MTRRLALFVLLVGVAGCAGPSRFSREPVRLSDLASEGDPARRASLRLVTRGLDSDSGGQAQLALSQYERAIQVDPNNPFAYLAIARHHVERGDPELVLQNLERSEALLEAQGVISPRVEPHLIGLRGLAYQESGRSAEATLLLARAGDLAPDVWGDGWLSADELR